MPNRESKLGYSNFVCWLFGHDVDGKIVVKSRRRVSGEMVDSLQQYCKRCQNPDNFPNHQYPDHRSLYWRTIPVWVFKLGNRWRFRNFDGEDWEMGKHDYQIHLLDEQLKKYGSPKTKK